MTAQSYLKEWERARKRMIEEQLKARDITSQRVLEAMDSVPRHVFVAEAIAAKAYSDGPLPIGFGQTISQPYMVALMTQLLNPGPGDRVLEIGSGCGYQTAVLSRLCAEVLAIERIAQLRDGSLENLAKIGVSNVSVRLGDGRLGWPERAPFQGILVAAYAERIPPELIGQLAEGGRLVIPVGPESVQELVLAVKDHKGRLVKKAISGCRFVPLL
ncbi:MAG: protein-L-isoaspartate(D-aspartate) O-methyltransferase [Deltaproteobacteria bacterium]|nr:protein-L-isoaspartate(D-aspartate) O-methyltransferase [Deltaproteobacteria bacterium]